MTGGGQEQTCTTEQDCQGVASSCDGPEDCEATEICCGTIQGATCQPGGQQCAGQMCHTESDCDQGEMCCNITGGLQVCQQACSGP